jgi:hypothetical protein
VEGGDHAIDERFADGRSLSWTAGRGVNKEANTEGVTSLSGGARTST